MKNIFKNTIGPQFLRALLDFLYPSFCLHCKKLSPHSEKLLCEDCLPLLELINPEERCSKCFSHDYDADKNICYACFITEPLLTKSAAAFDYLGPAGSLISQMKYANQPHLAKSAASFICMQFLQLNWPMPDMIIPVPLTFTHQITRGYNQSMLIAEELGKLLQVEVKDVLKRSLTDISQAGLERTQRLKLNSESFKIKKGGDMLDKTILLIDDVSTTGSTLNSCAKCLYEGYPKEVYGFTFCKGL